MRRPPNYKPEYFEQFRTTPLKIKPFNQESKNIANAIVQQLTQILNDTNIIVYHRGSTLFEIDGNGDIDIGINVPSKKFNCVSSLLQSNYGPPKATGKNFAAFYSKLKEYDIEISVMKDYPATVDLALTQYLNKQPSLLKAYQDIKTRFSFSKREYLIQRNIFLRKVIKQIP